MLVDWNRHPASNEIEMAEYAHRGELNYMAEKRNQALAFIATRPLTFVALTIRRIVFVWTGFWSFDSRYLSSEPLQLPFLFIQTSLSLIFGIGFWRLWKDQHPMAFPLMAITICHPLVYYVTHPALEYRHPIEPALVVVGSVGLVYVGSWLVCKRRGSVLEPDRSLQMIGSLEQRSEKKSARL